MPYAGLIDGDIGFGIELAPREYYVTLAILSMRGVAVPEVKNITLKNAALADGMKSAELSSQDAREIVGA
jgi:hypothetical protein